MKLLILSTALLMASNLFGQDVSYSYDSSGNRILRQPLSSNKTAPVDGITINDSIEDLPINRIRLFPNPTAEIIQISIDESEPMSAEVYLFDDQGKLLLTRSLERSCRLTLNHLPSGSYVVTVVSEAGRKSWSIIKL